jgi:hypothetical protein
MKPIGKTIFITIVTFVACGALVAATWYSSLFFVTSAYKVVSFFLGFILVSNILAKYIIWVIEPEGELMNG